jgi:hypothetical protein
MHQARCQWLMPVILATQVAENRRIAVQSQPRQIVRETLSRKSPSQKKGKKKICVCVCVCVCVCACVCVHIHFRAEV